MDNKIHTVIFDLDGTLSDSAVLTIEAFNRIAPGFGLPVPSIEAVRRATGISTPEFFYILLPDHDRETVYKAGLLMEKEEQQLLPSLSGRILFEGCREMLERLKEKGVRLCIASTGQKEHVFSILNETGIINIFDMVFCGRPDKTEMLREIIGKGANGTDCGAKGTDCGARRGCVMVGDMKKDYDAAREAGIISIGACYGYCIKEISDFDFYIHSPLELLDLLKI